MSNTTILVATLVACAPTVAWLVQAQRIAGRLRRNHPDIFEVLGRPDVVANNTPHTGASLLAFVLKKDHDELRDDELARMCRSGRRLFATSVAFIVGLLGLAVLSMVV